MRVCACVHVSVHAWVPSTWYHICPHTNMSVHLNSMCMAINFKHWLPPADIPGLLSRELSRPVHEVLHRIRKTKPHYPVRLHGSSILKPWTQTDPMAADARPAMLFIICHGVASVYVFD